MKYFILITSVFIQLNINAQTTLIPDANFEQALIDFGFDVLPINGSVPTANISSIDSLNVALRNINSMSGIEDFTSLTYLNCFDNQIYTLDVTQNLNLKYLICTLNNISVLDITQNVLLIDLFCSGNQLTSLNVTQNISLKRLLCGNNVITSLNLGQNTSLEHLESFNNQINNLDISQNTFLTYFTCSNNLLTTLNVQNGNNTNFSFFASTGNPSLTCIQVDNPSWSTANWTNIDAAASFSTNCSVGVEERLNKIDVVMYPNPAKNLLTIRLKDLNDIILSIKIIDVSGNTVFEGKIKPQVNTINISSLNKGFYSVLIQNDTEVLSSQKLLITI